MSLHPDLRHEPHASVQVGRLQQRFVCTDAVQAAQLSAQWPELTAAWQGSLQGVDDTFLATLPADPEEWVLIPRLQVHSRWRPQAPLSQWGVDWWQAVGQAVTDCVRSPQTHAVLRYRHRNVGLADLLYRSGLGDTSRQWAWHCMGLIDRSGLPPEEALRQGWAMICSQPGEQASVLQSLLRAERDTGAWTTVLRRLGASQWQQLRATLPGAWAGDARCVDLDAPKDRRTPMSPTEPMALQGTHAWLLSAWQAWVQRQPMLVGRWAVNADAGDTLAALLGSWCWPWASPGEVRARWPRWRAQVFEGAVSEVTSAARQVVRRALPDASAEASLREPAVRSSQTPSNGHENGVLVHGGSDREGAVDRHERHHGRTDEFNVPELPQQVDTRYALATAWAGACFWLGRLPRVWPVLCAELASRLSSSLNMHTGHPDLMEAEAHLGAALAAAMGVPPDDPVSRLWRGGFGVLSEHGSVDSHDVSAPWIGAVRQAARQQVQDWAERLWVDLGAEARGTAPCDLATPAAAMAWLVQRPATLRVEPGWVEVCFEPHQVDTRVRRLALDLDPGWVPLCQAVVRFRYD